MKNAYRLYSLVLLFCGLTVVVAMFAFAFYLDPLWGDLSRLGWYTENLYGSNSPEEIVKDKLYDKDIYSHYYDTVVMGDSFSHTNNDTLAARRVWQNAFFLRTGLSLTTFLIGRKDWREVVASPVFQATPPKLLIYEEVERNLMLRLGKAPPEREKCDDMAPMNDKAIPPFEVTSVSDSGRYFTAVERTHGQLDEKHLAYARDFISQRFRIAVGLSHPPVMEYPLTRPLFSSQRPNRLLVYSDDLEKSQWHDDALKNVSCNLRLIQREVEKNRRTRFVAIIVPDKLTAYSEFIANPDFKDLSVLDRIDFRSINLARIDRPLRNAIRQGQLEIYSSTNTHLSGNGYHILADALFDYLLQRRMAMLVDHAPAITASNPPRGKLSCSVEHDGNVQIESGEAGMPPSLKVNYYLASKNGEQFHFFVRGSDGQIRKIAWKSGALPVYRRGTLKASLTLGISASEKGEIWSGWGENDADMIEHTRYVRCGRRIE